jgi:SAM-dependent methyltransferase
MNSEGVAQLGPLAEMFGEALRSFQPESVAILGVAGGNGLERVDPAVTSRVCGIDINPDYLSAVRQRHAALPGLELHCLDLAAQRLEAPPVEMVHAALIFEHAGLELCLNNAIDLVVPGGVLSVVLQLPSAVEPAVGNSDVESVQAQRHNFQFVDRDALTQALETRGFHFVRLVERPLPGGKAFWMGFFKRSL